MKKGGDKWGKVKERGGSRTREERQDSKGVFISKKERKGPPEMRRKGQKSQVKKTEGRKIRKRERSNSFLKETASAGDGC